MLGLRRIDLCQNTLIGDKGVQILANSLKDDLWIKGALLSASIFKFPSNNTPYFVAPCCRLLDLSKMFKLGAFLFNVNINNTSRIIKINEDFISVFRIVFLRQLSAYEMLDNFQIPSLELHIKLFVIFEDSTKLNLKR